MKNVLVAMDLTEERKQRILEAASDCNVVFGKNPAEEEIKNAEMVIGNLNVDLLMSSETLRFVQLHSAGVGKYRQLCAPGRDVRLCCASGAYGLAISEHMFAMLLAIRKKIIGYRDVQHAGKWKDLGKVRSICGSSVLVIGMGNIGSEFAKRCHAFGAKVIGIRRTAGECPEYCVNVGTMIDIDKYLPEADVVFMAVPETQDTIRLMNRERLDLMKPDAILLNAGRGTAIDTDALVDALNEERIFGAGLDVTDPEPLPEEHPLWSCGNVLVTPHISGGEHMEQTVDNIVDIACGNIRAYLEGGSLKSEVNYERGY